MPTKAYSYLRFSSSAQSRGDSLRRQLAAAEAWAAERPHIELDTTLRDLGVSAFKGDNRVKGALASFLERIKLGQVERGSYFLLESFDRLSRESETQAINLLTGITLAGVKVVTLLDGHEYDDKAEMIDLMRALIVMSRSHNENKARTDKVAQAWKAKKEEARRTGKVLSRRGPAWCVFNEETKRFDLIAERGRIIQRIFSECNDGLGITAIASRLNASTEEPFVKGSDGWHQGYVLTILRSPSVCGFYQPTLTANRPGQRMLRIAEGDAIANYYPRVVSDEVFHTAQAMIAKRNKRGGGKGRRGKSFPNILVGLGRCEECSGTLILGSRANSTAVRHFRCYQQGRKHRCLNDRRYNCADVEELLMAFLITARMEDKQPSPDAAILTVRSAQLEQVKRKIGNLIDQMEDNEDVAERLAQRRLERAALEREVRALWSSVQSHKPQDDQDALQEASEWLSRVEGQTTPEDLYLQRAKANALLQDRFEVVMPYHDLNGEMGLYVVAGEKGWRVTDELFTEIAVTSSEPPTRAVLERCPVVSRTLV